MFHEKEKAVYSSNGSLYKYTTDPILPVPVNVSEVITADGYEKQMAVVVANGTLPGPSIIAYEDQILVVHVKNNLMSETVFIHWHGIEQRGTPSMDGAGFASQCPIDPGQSFTYTFNVGQGGTYWYRSQSGVQRGRGLYGALVVRERNPPSHLQNVSEEFIIQLQDWNHDYDANREFLSSEVGELKISKIITFDSIWNAHSSLINGKGRYHNPDTGNHNEAPLQVFEVDEGELYRFRVINAASMYSYRVSVDNHSLTMVSSDAHLITPVVVESVIVHPGERFDFILNAKADIGNYMIRGVAQNVINSIPAEAVLHYAGADEMFVSVSSMRNPCTSTEKCAVLNCQVVSFPMEPELQCITVDSTTAYIGNVTSPEGSIHEYFLNFAVAGPMKYLLPPNSAKSHYNNIKSLCSKAECKNNNKCTCINIIDINYNDTILFVFLNMGKQKRWDVQIHMHGHSFEVLKVGYANYNETTGEYISENSDINCGGNTTEDENCNGAAWSNPDWLNGNDTGLNLVNPPQKDTVTLPYGGYVIARIKADNPGMWAIAYQMLPLVADGIAVLLNESFENQPKIPDNFPTCGDFGGIEPDLLISTPAPTTTTPIPTTTEPARCVTPGDCRRHTNLCFTEWQCINRLCHCKEIHTTPFHSS
ncbi:uncharacterized protein LOC133192695 [Saccostrea echinata]|uniref:uncharacterized protein LOC133192695 n=1 Tax=Saccostrea echinata TaxID=191078 RepID=UPI002A7F98B7|nr:uncharacterized protein LOC133192695 [Saccostrea echinata]